MKIKQRCRIISLMLVGSLLFLYNSCQQANIPQASATRGEAMQGSPIATIVKPVHVETRALMSSTPSPLATAEITPGTVEEMLVPTPVPPSITIVYDNNEYDQRLKSAWGFSALVEYHNHTLLFDTGGDGPTLIGNMRILGRDPFQIESVVLSHAHGDHTGGLSGLFERGARPVVYLPASFPDTFKSQLAKTTEVIEVTPGLSVAEGMYSIGEIGHSIPEQALIIQTGQGLVIVTGCAHPGIVEIVEQARRIFAERVRLVLGGFHLGNKSEAEIGMILKEFRRLEVEQVAPCHCTGERAIAMFAAEYGEDFIRAGVGRVIRLDALVPK